jgi:hypothetical protein
MIGINLGNTMGKTKMFSFTPSQSLFITGTTPILDSFPGAQTAYSIARKLRTDYSGSAIRVRTDAPDPLINGDFTTDTTGWNMVGSGSIAATGGQLVNTNGNYNYAYQDIPVEIGRTYTISIDFEYVDVNGLIRLGSTSQGLDYFSDTVTSTNTYTYQVTATTTTLSISLWCLSATGGLVTKWDNITIQQYEADIGFDANGDLDEAALLAHTGSNNGYVVKTYDQSGNGNDWVQPTANLQPKIVNAGAVEKVNGKPAIFSDEVGASHDFIESTLTGGAVSTIFSVVKGSSSGAMILLNDKAQLAGFIGAGELSQGSASYNSVGTPTIYANGSTIGTTRDDMYDAILSTHTIITHTNVDCSGFTGFRTNYDGTIYPAVDYTQETIIYDSDKSSDRATIEANINEYYTIY